MDLLVNGPAKSSRMRKSIQNSALVLASIVVFLALLEVVLRVLNGVPLLKVGNFVADRMSEVTTRSNNRYDPLLGWIPSEGWTPPGGNAPLIGKYGVWLKPGDPFATPQHAILAVGDSFTVGSDVPTEQSWPAYLQRDLQQPVVNAAAGGYGVDQIVLRAESLLDVLQPKIVVMSYLVDDIARNGFRSYGAEKPYFIVRDGYLIQRNVPVPTFSESRNLGTALSVLGYLYSVDWYLRWAGYSELE